MKVCCQISRRIPFFYLDGLKSIITIILTSKRNRPWQDSNLQSPDPKSGALSIRPHGLRCWFAHFCNPLFCFLSSSVAIICNSRRPFHFGQASVNQMTRNTILVQLNFIQKIYGTKTFSLIKKMSNSCEKTHIYDICFILKKTQTQSQR